jgi:uncharacterized protein YidB (DUF937 family)
MLSCGLANIINELQESGHGRIAQSWVGTGANEEIVPGDLANALGSDALSTLSKQSGLRWTSCSAASVRICPS